MPQPPKKGVAAGVGIALIAIGVGLLSGSYVALTAHHPAPDGGESGVLVRVRAVDWQVVGGLLFGGIVAVWLGWAAVRVALRRSLF